jgi:hypothetical protein
LNYVNQVESPEANVWKGTIPCVPLAWWSKPVELYLNYAPALWGLSREYIAKTRIFIGFFDIVRD